MTAVGREAASVSTATSTSSPRSAASASPYAAAIPIAGAPRTASDADRLRDLGRGVAPQLDLLAGEAALVEDDDGVVLEADDPVWLELGLDHDRELYGDM